MEMNKGLVGRIGSETNGCEFYFMLYSYYLIKTNDIEIPPWDTYNPIIQHYYRTREYILD